MKIILRSNALTNKLDRTCRSWSGSHTNSIWVTGTDELYSSCTRSSSWWRNSQKSLATNRRAFSLSITHVGLYSLKK